MRLMVFQHTTNTAAHSQCVDHIRHWKNCTVCEIGKKAYLHVFYRGTLPCEFLFIGEAPGPQEDYAGLPFVGPSGDLLNMWIRACSPVQDNAWWAITNTVCCIPRDTNQGRFRPPTDEEVKNCGGRLNEFVEIARPKAIVFLGKVASSRRSKMPKNLPKLELKHPSYVIRQGGKRSELFEREKGRLIEFVRAYR